MSTEAEGIEEPAFVMERSAGDLTDVVGALLPYVAPKTWLFLEGDLGAGKTTLAGALLSALGAPGEGGSPTFGLLHALNLPRAVAGVARILHLDLYRLKEGRELCYLGLEAEFAANTCALFEWASVVEPEDWEAFFVTTGCSRPRAVHVLTIERAGPSGSSRRYALTRIA